MLDVPSLFVAVTCTTSTLFAALWFGSRGQRRDGMATFLGGLGMMLLSTAILSAQARLPFVIGVPLANGLFVCGAVLFPSAFLEFGRERVPRWWAPASFAGAFFVCLVLRSSFAGRVLVINGALAVWLGFGARAAYRVARGNHRGVRGLLVFGMALCSATGLLRIGMVFSPAEGGILRPGPVQVYSAFGMLAGISCTALAFLMLQRDRAERGLAELNATLEARVAEQVALLATRAKELGRLNIELQEKARERSEELDEAQSEPDAVDAVGVGSVLRERYAIERELGRGGMGVVYRATDRATGEPVAVKVIGAQSAGHLGAMRRLLDEARASASVEHPGAVFARHVDVTGANLFLVFELVDGLTLDEARRRGARFSPGLVALLGARVAEALAAAHEKGVLHRDVKPANVMLSADGEPVRLLDFGIARLRDAVSESGVRESTATGTPAYMAPEQALDEEGVDGRADVYALGVVLFELLAGRLPFEAREARGQLLGRVAGAAPSVEVAAQGLPAGLAAAVDGCLRREAADRPGARELAARLRRVAEACGAAERELAAMARLPRDPGAANEVPLGATLISRAG